ncbi:MAG: NYN domain-containing protein [Candidatus Puniceispirillales bacterium]
MVDTPFHIRKDDRFAVFIDGSNFHATARSLGFEVDYEKLLTLLKTSGRLLRAYYYTALPDGADYAPIRKLSDWLDYNGYTMVTKSTREFTDQETGKRRIKGNMDMELALDMLKLAPHIDHAILFSGDGDFCRLIHEIQDLGIRVSVVSTVQTRPPLMADTLRRQTDDFIDVETLRQYIARPPREHSPDDRQEQYSYHHHHDDGGEAEIIDDRRER